MPQTRFLSAIFFLLTLISCEVDEEPLIDNEIMATDINFYPEEVYPSNQRSEPELKLKFVTTEIYPCYNYSIDLSHSYENGELVIKLNKIKGQEVCLTALGPARAYVDLPETTEILTLIKGESVDKYEVNITEEKVELQLIESSFSNLQFESTFRYPENTFALICGTNLEDTEICQDFYDILLEHSSVSEFYFEGEGRIPYPETSSGHGNDTPSRFFSYQEEEDLEEVRELLENFSSERIEPDSGNSLSIITWDNQRFTSW